MGIKYECVKGGSAKDSISAGNKSCLLSKKSLEFAAIVKGHSPRKGK